MRQERIRRRPRRRPSCQPPTPQPVGRRSDTRSASDLLRRIDEVLTRR